MTVRAASLGCAAQPDAFPDQLRHLSTHVLTRMRIFSRALTLASFVKLPVSHSRPPCR